MGLASTRTPGLAVCIMLSWVWVGPVWPWQGFLLGGPEVVISGVTSPLIWAIIMVTILITPHYNYPGTSK